MLVELRVRDLGVIDDVTLELGPGMTALTGETGAGKTLIVEALELLVGGRADPALVRPGAPEALVEARFVPGTAAGVDGGAGPGGEAEVVLARAVAARGRSRAWVDGRMAPVSALAEQGRALLDLHGQHAHQSLLEAAAQRLALDTFGAVDLTALGSVRARLQEVARQLEALGGDDRARTREADLLRYQLDEIDGARIEDEHEDERLAEEEGRLAGAAGDRLAAAAALAALAGGDAGVGLDVGTGLAGTGRIGTGRVGTGLGDVEAVGSGGGRGVVDALGDAMALIGERAPLARFARRVEALQAEAADVAAELRDVVENWEEDPERLDAVRVRRQELRDLRRKYGDSLGEVLAYAREIRSRLDDLESVEARGARLQAERDRLEAERVAAEAAVGASRRAAAPRLAEAVEAGLHRLGMARAVLQVRVGERDPGDDVVLLLGANPGEPAMALAKVASGGELARTMLALRLVLTGAPPTLVFDEVDAGVGGEAAVAVGRALSEVARRHQVLVVTHLPQVAAGADHQLAVTKSERDGRTVSTVTPLAGEDRVVELARMLSGRPDSATARRHAEELLAGASGSHR